MFYLDCVSHRIFFISTFIRPAAGSGNTCVHLKCVWSGHIVIAKSVFRNTSLCVGNGVCMVFVRMHSLYIWP